MRKFLVIKSTKQQLSEGVDRPVDTAYIESKEGGLLLKAVFDVKQFKPEEIDVQVGFVVAVVVVAAAVVVNGFFVMVVVVVVVMGAIVVVCCFFSWCSWIGVKCCFLVVL